MSRAAAVAAYGQAWHERDETARLALLQQVWADDGVYCEPLEHHDAAHFRWSTRDGSRLR